MISILKDFKNRGGGWFFSSSIFDKITRVSLTFALIAFLSKKDFAYWTYAFTLVSTFIPIKSLGIEAGILQYGSGLNENKINELFKSMFIRGLTYSCVFALLCSSFTAVFFNYSNSVQILIYILCFWLPGLFLFELLLNYYRIIKQHKKYALVQSFYNIVFIFSLLLGYLIDKTFGVALAFVITPFITFIRFKPKFLTAKKIIWDQFEFRANDIIFYGFKSSFTNYATTLLFYTDIFLIEYLTKDEMLLSEYRTATIIPFNLSFFAVLYLNNDFVFLVENKLNKSVLIDYLKNYFYLFFSFTCICLIILYPFAEFWWSEVLFKGEYMESVPYFKVLLLATIAMIILRIPSGNLLSAIGKVHLNTIIGYLTIAVNLIVSIGLFKYYGIKGIAYSTVISLVLSGFAMCFFLFKYLNKK